MKARNDKEKSPVTIRYKTLKNGNQSIYLDCYPGNGRREYKFLNLYLRPGKSREDKEWNKTQMELATAIKSQYIVDLQIGFIDYLNHEANDFDTRSTDENRVKKPLSDVYKEALFARIMVALNKAEREGIIIKNPGKDIDHKLKPRAKESSRCYLTLGEVKKIIETPYTADNDVKPAFLFNCFSGLRHSDLVKLTWGEIKQTAEGHYQIETIMKKTKTASFRSSPSNPAMRTHVSKPSFATPASTRMSASM